ncbi:L,D-transpeptidase [uncultured Thiocystis sp.]|jgi:lipoprotein-anchoring transpeptidase ErfK/SrfK|uniref:L,D-transpeptidase n=1 Tax=uncultured Thiocystis sp. TaxID=1202134 RepID=UPI0025EA11A2|nr:L,D-transpeptidase [uncultured Thiocystis sp.]
MSFIRNASSPTIRVAQALRDEQGERGRTFDRQKTMPSLLCKWPPLLTVIFLIGCAQTPSRPAPESAETTFGAVGQQEFEPQSESSRTESPAAQPEASGRDNKPRSLTIKLGTQQFIYSVNGEIARTGPISSGAVGYPTPTGKFAVLGKEKDKVSSRYTNQLGMQAWMPYAIQFHGHYFLHEGWLPGYPDSHGCVRLGEKDARFLFEQMQLGDPVDVVD